MGLHYPIIAMQDEKKVVGGILLFAILHGILFIALVPPWQHYDEPGHFEYAWLIANRGGIPAAGVYDQGMRRELAASMIEHKFFVPLGYRPNLVSQSEPIWIGVSQTGDVPLYYLLVSLPLHLVRTSDITFQLYLGRFVSLTMYALSILACYGLVTEITKPGNVLRWVVPISLVCMPGYTDIMTAVNNDVGAAVFFSFYLWACLRIMVKGFSVWRLIAILFLAAVCLLTKSTVWMVIFITPLPILYAVFNKKLRKHVVAALLLVFAIILAFIFSPDGMASWYTQGTYHSGQRIVDEQVASSGEAFLSLPILTEDIARIYQPLQYSHVLTLRGQDVTLGAWIWADEPTLISPIIIQDSEQQMSAQIELDTTPQFFTVSTTISPDADYINVILKSIEGKGTSVTHVYFDDVILVAGDFTQSGIPELDMSVNATIVNWSGKYLENLVRNPSFEHPWLQVRYYTQSSLVRRSLARLSQSVTSLSDLSTSGWYYTESIHNLFRTFWGKFGWGNVLLEGRYTYHILLVLTIVGLVGVILLIWMKRKYLAWDFLVFLLVPTIFGWVAALLRGIESLSGTVFIGSSRYAFPVMIPTLLLLSTGWIELIARLRTKLGMPAAISYVLYWSIFISLDILSWWSIWHYYSSLT